MVLGSVRHDTVERHKCIGYRSVRCIYGLLGLMPLDDDPTVREIKDVRIIFRKIRSLCAALALNSDLDVEPEFVQVVDFDVVINKLSCLSGQFGTRSDGHNPRLFLDRIRTQGRGILQMVHITKGSLNCVAVNC